MAVDYAARKTAKKDRKKAREDDEGRRIRKKGGPRRLCRGVCYQEPGLTEGDLEGEGRAARGAFMAEKRAREEAVELAREERGGPRRKHKAGDGPKAPTGGGDGAAPPPTPAPAARDRAGRGAPARARAGRGGDDAADARGDGGADIRPTQPPPAEVPAPLARHHPLIQQAMQRLGHTQPMPVQDAAWPALISGRDVCAIAAPGAGKTVAYLLPAALRIAERRERDAAEAGERAGEGDAVGGEGESRKAPASPSPASPTALVIVPTRELAQQVAKEARTALKARVALVHGGVDRDAQILTLTTGAPVDLLVATPGRLLDVISAKAVKLANVTFVVLDEADRMLGMGFAEAIESIRASLSRKRPPQVAFFTATLPPEAREAVGRWARGQLKQEEGDEGTPAQGGKRESVEPTEGDPPSPVFVRVSATDARSVSGSIVQTVHVCAEHKKLGKLQKALWRIEQASRGQRNPPRVLIFVNRIKTARFLAKHLGGEGEDSRGQGGSDGAPASGPRRRSVLALHGDLSQAERDQATASFRAGSARILVATDVAARGLHVRNLPHVVNYDFPSTLEQYVHRIGRTGRVSESGNALSFLPRELAFLAEPLISLLGEHDQQIDPNLVKLAEAYAVAKARMADGGETEGGAIGSEAEEDEGEGTAAASRPPPLAPRPDVNAVRAELGLKAIRKKRKSKDEAADGGDAAAASGRAANPPEGPVPSPAAAPAPSFVSTPIFLGARAGMCFKKGPKGVGYYPDAAQRSASEAAAVAASKRLRRARHELDKRPVGGPAKGDAGSPEGGFSPLLKRKAAATKPAAAKPSTLPGKLWRASGRQGGSISDGSDDEAPAAPASRGAVLGRKKALPGRLRKKAAKDAAKLRGEV